jgi:hypothetical protein
MSISNVLHVCFWSALQGELRMLQSRRDSPSDSPSGSDDAATMRVPCSMTLMASNATMEQIEHYSNNASAIWDDGKGCECNDATKRLLYL